MTKDEIIEMARQAGINYRDLSDEFATGNGDGVEIEQMQDFAKLVEEKERKACAELCMDLHTLTDGAHNFYHFAANQILKRGQA